MTYDKALKFAAEFVNDFIGKPISKSMDKDCVIERFKIEDVSKDNYQVVLYAPHPAKDIVELKRQLPAYLKENEIPFDENKYGSS
jgi:hypothetical protein